MKNSNFDLFVEKTAKEKIKILLKKKHINDYFRIYIMGGGCSGFQYEFDVDKKSNDDYILEKEKIIVDSLSAQYLFNAGLYFEKNLYGERFVVKNPQAKTTCSCGSSFSI